MSGPALASPPRDGAFGRSFVAWLAAGIALRLAMAYPVYAWSGDADAVGTGITALDVLRGEMPVFYSSYRLGSLPALVAAGLFFLFGVSRQVLVLGPVLVGGLFVVAGHLFHRELLGGERARWALPFLAVPAPAFLFWSQLPVGYAETLALGAATLWLAARARRDDAGAPTWLALGVATGLAFWTNPISVAVAGPAWLWLAASRRRLDLGRWPLAGLGVAVGAAPWLAFNLRYGWPSIKLEPAVQPSGGLPAALDNLRYTLLVRLPELLAGDGTEPPATRGHHGLGQWLFALALALAVAAFFAPSGERPRGARVLFAALLAAVVVLNVASDAGSIRTPSVRYVLPAYLVVPGALASLLLRLRRRSRGAALALAAAILAADLALGDLPWSRDRAIWRERALRLDAVAAYLAERDVDAVLAPYWEAYPITFLSRGEIVAVPADEWTDGYFRVSRRLGEGPRRWALAGSPSFLAACRAGGLDPRATRFGPALGVAVLEPSPAGPAPEVLARLRRACRPRPGERP